MRMRKSNCDEIAAEAAQTNYDGSFRLRFGHTKVSNDLLERFVNRSWLDWLALHRQRLT